MRRLIFVLFLLTAMIVHLHCSPIDDRPRRDLKALERIMKEMVASHSLINSPAFRPG
ncbi:hypothetical protein OESDEN_17606 [Oesophagostomum dentatum]|uniref:Uncharacterized protein n=1 Tax=Oesophagostomum dentatum TaxID=61180 RepID=A0A0B1SCQ7_OESDE|nr:hypothetical protein OESDEN_17606 [Oesophagostomum dentatum]